MKLFSRRALATCLVVFGLLHDVPQGAAASNARIPTVRPEAKVETDPVPSGRDAADDPAIWIHPTDSSQSLILGTDKRGALHVYDMESKHLQAVAEGTHPNNVDVLYGFKLGNALVDIAVAGVRAPLQRGIKVWCIDPETRRLSDITDGGVIRVLNAGEPYGSCVYRSPRSDRAFFFVTDLIGRVEQYALEDAGDGKIKAAKVREVLLSSVVEGCVADHELGHLYLAQEDVGIWKLGAEPDAGNQRKLIARIKENGLAADVEGLSIYYASEGRGYLIASSQGNNTFKVYDREADNRLVLTIDPKAGQIDDVSDTDGICVTSCPTSRRFPKGVFVVQDGKNDHGKQNFKLYAWEDIAGSTLIIDTNWSPRAVPPQQK